MSSRKASVAAALLAAALAVPGGAAGEWDLAEGSRHWSFPEDHGAHRRYRTEWWYFTGQLESEGGRVFGYQLTFFRFGAAPDPRPPGSAWAIRDLYAAHFAITDVGAGEFGYAERISREGPGLAGAGSAGMGVRLLDWSLQTREGGLRLSAREGSLSLELELRTAEEPLLHGEGGLSRKGGERGQASWYYSLTELDTAGRVRTPWSEGSLEVRGRSWFDHEFGSSQLSAQQVGWDWFSLRLDDGRRLMLYLLRRGDGSPDPFSAGTLREVDGSAAHLTLREFRIEETGTWVSPRSGGRYPSGWRVTVPGGGIDLQIAPFLRDQELVTGNSTGVTYWEGAVRGRGFSGGVPVVVEGYVELTGYAGSLGGLF